MIEKYFISFLDSAQVAELERQLTQDVKQRTELQHQLAQYPCF